MKYSVHREYKHLNKSAMTLRLLTEEAAEEFMNEGFTPRFRRLQERLKIRNMA